MTGTMFLIVLLTAIEDLMKSILSRLLIIKNFRGLNIKGNWKCTLRFVLKIKMTFKFPLFKC